MSQNLLSLLINLIAAAIGGLSVWGWRKWMQGRRRRRRLLELKKAASEGEVALCVRVGGGGDPVPDVLKFLREKHPNIKRLVVYRISAEEADNKLHEPELSNRIVKDLYDIVRAYGEGEVSRIHFFSAGMLAYPLVFGAMLNWCTVVVYYQWKHSYVPLYELDKEWIYKRQHEFRSFKDWEMLDVDADSISTTPPAVTAGSVPSVTPNVEVTKGR